MASLRRLAILLSALLGLALFAMVPAGCGAQTPAQKPAAPSTESAPSQKPLLDFHQIVLGNGLRVLSVEDFAAPVVDVQVWYHVGSKDEKPDRTGFAHMFEHMMFRGTDRLGPTAHFDLIRKAGGFCNGSTGFDRTDYVETLPASQIELVLWLEAERMAFLKIDQNSFDTERKVVEEELRLRRSGPYGGIDEKTFAELYHVHPYRWLPIGRIADLRQTTVPELRDFWMRYYGPNNATLIVTGAVKTAEVQALAKKYFGWIPSAPPVPRETVREPMPTAPRTVTLTAEIAPSATVDIFFRSTPAAHEDRLALDLLANILGDGTSSRLYRALVDARLAVRAEADNDCMEQDGLFSVGATLPPAPPSGLAANEAKIAKAREVLEQHLQAARTEKVTDRELLKARNQVMRSLITGGLTVHGKGGMLGRAAVIQGDPNRVNEMMERLRRITPDDILLAAQKWLDPNHSLTTIIPQHAPARGPASAPAEDIGEGTKVTAVRETNPPPPGRPGAVRPADYPKDPPLAKAADLNVTLEHSESVLPNGMKVIVVSDHRAPFVNVDLNLRGGAITEGKPGTCAMALGMLTKGAGGRGESQIADELDTYAISLRGSGHMDSSALNGSCLTENLDRLMGLMGDAALRPAFPAAEFEKMRQRVRANLAMSQGSPGWVADRELRRRLFGDHPYARESTGEAADVDALKVEDLKQWWSTYARPDQAVLIFAGDIAPQRAVDLAMKTFGDWKAKGDLPRLTLPPLPPRSETHIYLVDRPGALQSQIRLAQLSITRKDPLYFASRVVDGYFGRGFGARLNKSLRVDKGYTYGIGGGLSVSPLAGRFVISTFSKNEVTAPAIQAILDEVKRLRAEKPSDAEFADTRSAMLGGFLTSHETASATAGDLWLIEQERLPADWIQQSLTRCTQVTAQDCLDAVNKTVDETKLVIIVAGDAEKLKKPLEAIAPVTVVSGGFSGATSVPASKAAASAAME